jgi:uncharacterized protein
MGQEKIFRDKWALVTGASAGIGVALARELARAGAKLILTARRAERLESLAAELRAQGSEVRIVVADLNDPAAPEEIQKAVADLKVEILINNAGLGQFGLVIEAGVEQEISQVRVNCEAMVHLTRLFVPAMVERGAGWVMIVSSVASFQPLPYMATYAATKVFDRFFALALAEEVAGKGVCVSALCPGSTKSEFHDVSRAGDISGRKRQSAEEVARLGVLGLIQGKRIVVPLWSGRWVRFVSWLMPTGIVTQFVAGKIRSRR